MKTEQLGIVAAKQCSKCAGCKDCSYRNTMMTWQDQKELTMIEDVLCTRAKILDLQVSYARRPS